MTDNNLLKAKALLNKYREGTCTDEEKAWVEEWYLSLNRQQTDLSDQELAADLRDLQSRLTDITTQSASRLKYRGITIAASLLLISGLGLYFYNVSQKTQTDISQSVVITDAPAGTNKAVLILSDGRKISLSDAMKGMVANESNVRINKTADGQIIYTVSGEKDNQPPSINTIETPKGGQYQVTLPDGSKVWLNAASTLSYAPSLRERGDDKRRVHLTGEAYFQIAKDKKHPFVVTTRGQQVEVLGTHFNVNSYHEEGRTVTTLEEGSVQVQSGKVFKIIRPGQQSIVSAKGDIAIRQADMQTALAWKNNEMVFKDAGVEEIMRQIARWYDLEVQYEGAIPDDTITASIDRQSNLSTVLKIFDTIQIHFTLMETPTGKKLIIKP